MRNKRAGKFAGFLLAAAMTASAVAPQAVLADAQKVVTLGADLSEEQQAAILKYFGVSGQNIETIYVNNQDERDLLSSYIPLDVIGTRTLSCAYVNPTSSGGIQVKTANLNWVTSNMIASALSTSGVRNCEVIAACPREVSGTGALTGVLKAYETAAGTVLDATKKEIAAQEIVTTGELANTVGQDEATQIVNEIKIAIIESEVTEDEDERIQAIVDDAVNRAILEIQAERDELVALNNEQKQELQTLAENIAAQQYNYDDVKETLERVEQNVSTGDVNVNVNITNEVNGGDNTATAETGDNQTELAQDSILLNTDDTALGENVIMDATDEAAVPQTDENTENASDEPFAITTTDEGTFGDTGEAGDAQTETPATEEQTGELSADDLTNIAEQINGDAGTEEQYVEEQTGDDITVADPDDAYIEENPDAWVDETPVEESPRADEPAEEEPAAAAPQLSFGADDTKTFNGFSLKLYTDGELIPASGTVTLTDDYGAETKIDLSADGAYGVIPVEDSSLLGRLGYDEALEIHVLTDKLSLASGSYHAAAEIVFAEADDNGKPVAGTETAAVTAEADVTCIPSGLVPVRDGSVYTAPTTITIQAYGPEGTVSADIASSDESVAIPGLYVQGEAGGSFDVDLDDVGDVVITATYYNEAGEYIGEDSIAIAAF